MGDLQFIVDANQISRLCDQCFVLHFVHYLCKGFLCGSLHKESYEEISDSTETSKKHAVVVIKCPCVV